MQNHQDAITLEIHFHAPHYKRQVTAVVSLCGHGMPAKQSPFTKFDMFFRYSFSNLPYVQNYYER